MKYKYIIWNEQTVHLKQRAIGNALFVCGHIQYETCRTKKKNVFINKNINNAPRETHIYSVHSFIPWDCYARGTPISGLNSNADTDMNIWYYLVLVDIILNR